MAEDSPFDESQRGSPLHRSRVPDDNTPHEREVNRSYPKYNVQEPSGIKSYHASPEFVKSDSQTSTSLEMAHPLAVASATHPPEILKRRKAANVSSKEDNSALTCFLKPTQLLS